MIAEKKALDLTAHLSLARTAIDNAELRIIGAITKEDDALQLSRAGSEIAAAASNLRLAAEMILGIAQDKMERLSSAAAPVRPNAG
jgi:hypothetical protein